MWDFLSLKMSTIWNDLQDRRDKDSKRPLPCHILQWCTSVCAWSSCEPRALWRQQNPRSAIHTHKARCSTPTVEQLLYFHRKHIFLTSSLSGFLLSLSHHFPLANIWFGFCFLLFFLFSLSCLFFPLPLTLRCHLPLSLKWIKEKVKINNNKKTY